MTKIIITGSKGRMGRALIACAPNFRELELPARLTSVTISAQSLRAATWWLISVRTRHTRGCQNVARSTKALVIGTTATRTPTRLKSGRRRRNSDCLGVEFFDRCEHAVLAHAQGGGNPGTGLRPGNHRNASSPEKGRAERHGKKHWRKFWPACASCTLIKRHGMAG